MSAQSPEFAALGKPVGVLGSSPRPGATPLPSAPPAPSAVGHWPLIAPSSDYEKASHARRLTRPLIAGALVLSVLALVIGVLAPLGLRARSAVPTARTTATSTVAAATALPQRNLPGEAVVSRSPIEDTVNWYLSQMSLDEKLGQLIMVETYSTGYGGDIADMVVDQHAGALIVYKKNMITPQQLKDMVAGVQAHSQVPLFITMDEEGGNVDRLGDMGFAPPLPSAHSLGASGDPHLAYKAGARAAEQLKAFGINVDLAPDVDVRTIADPVIGPRIFGTSAQSVDAYSGAFLDGLQQNGVIGTLKHWPGIGGVDLDPHKTLPVLTRSRAQLENTDFAAFRGLLTKQPGMIMVTHVLVNAIDPNLPSSLSPALVQGVLRGELGYQGVVITDNLWMKGVSLRYSLDEAAVQAILAGDDLLEGPWNPATMRQMLGGLRTAVQSGRISQERVDQSVRRILTLKAQYGILPPHAAPASAADQPPQTAASTAAQSYSPADVRRLRRVRVQ